MEPVVAPELVRIAADVCGKVTQLLPIAPAALGRVQASFVFNASAGCRRAARPRIMSTCGVGTTAAVGLCGPIE
jgi:hypothetical protein